MKKIYTIFLAAAALTAVQGCQSMLDSQQDDRVESERSIFEYLNRADRNINRAFYPSVYGGILNAGNVGGYMMAGYCDEAQESSSTSDVHKWYKGMSSSSSFPLFKSAASDDVWSLMFGGIYICNSGIHYLQLEDLKPEYDNETRQKYLSQYYALRAMDYLLLVKRFGGVPIVKENLPEDHDYSKDSRASFAKCVDLIISDCDKAEEVFDLPWFSGSPTHFPVMSRGALAAIRSQAALYAASPLWAEDYKGTEKYTWERAAKITRKSLKDVLANKGALVTDKTSFPQESASGVNCYDKYFLSAYPNGLSWDTETLNQPYYYGTIRCQLWQYNGLPLDPGQTRCGACPSQEMVDAYDVVSADGTVAVPLLKLDKPYNEDGTPNFNPEALALGYKDCDPAMYANRDPRFYATIYYNGSKATRNGGEVTIETCVGGNCGITDSPSNVKNTVTGYYLRKFLNADSGADNGNKDGYVRAFRLAELYLNFAEAAYMAYGPDTEVDGMTARQAVNAVRERVGLPGITETGEAFLLRLKNERRVELAFEEHRFFDLRRWSTPGSDLSGTDSRVSGMLIDEDGNYRRIFFERNAYSSKYLKFPLPLDEVRKMLKYTGTDWQNPGW